MEFIIIRASVILFLSISVQNTHAMIPEMEYEWAAHERDFFNLDPPEPYHGLRILPYDFPKVCEKGGKQNRNRDASPIADPGFAMYKMKLVRVNDETPSFNLLPCTSPRGIFYMKRIADGFEDHCFVMYMHSPQLGSGGTYLRGESSRQPC